VVGPVVGALVLIALLIAVYRFVPNRSFRLSEIWPGAVFAGILIEVVSLVFPIYAPIAHGFNTYGQQFALFFLIGTCLYLLSQLLLLGAVFNRMRLGPPREEGMVAEPGDRGQIPPPPAEAIDEQREQAGSRPAAPASNRREGSSRPGQDQRHRDTDRQSARRDEPEPGRAAATGESPRGKLKQALFGVLGAVIGLIALARARKASARGLQ
jgi:uncharacterized membrane protein HdeD (DUF308 family)